MRQMAPHGSATFTLRQFRNHLARNGNFASIAAVTEPAARRNGTV